MREVGERAGLRAGCVPRGRAVRLAQAANHAPGRAGTPGHSSADGSPAGWAIVRLARSLAMSRRR